MEVLNQVKVDKLRRRAEEEEKKAKEEEEEQEQAGGVQTLTYWPDFDEEWDGPPIRTQVNAGGRQAPAAGESEPPSGRPKGKKKKKRKSNVNNPV